MKYIAHVNPQYFAAISLFVAKGDPRYYLKGVCIEPHPNGGVIIVATDGHALGAIHDPDGWCQERIIVGGLDKALIGICKKRAVRVHPLANAVQPKKLWISDGGAVVSYIEEQPENPFVKTSLYVGRISIIEGDFPEWGLVIPSERVPLEGQFPVINSMFFNRFTEAQKILSATSHRYGTPISMESMNAHSSVVVRMHGVLLDRFVGVIMPMREDPVPTLIPAWAKPVLKAAKDRRDARSQKLAQKQPEKADAGGAK